MNQLLVGKRRNYLQYEDWYSESLQLIRVQLFGCRASPRLELHWEVPLIEDRNYSLKSSMFTIALKDYMSIIDERRFPVRKEDNRVDHAVMHSWCCVSSSIPNLKSFLYRLSDLTIVFVHVTVTQILNAKYSSPLSFCPFIPLQCHLHQSSESVRTTNGKYVPSM